MRRLGWLALVTAAFLAACGGSSRTPRQSVGGIASSGASSRSSGDYARHALAIGRLPNGQGFGIWAQRYRFRRRPHVQIIAATVPAASSIAQLQRELNSGRYGSSETNVDQFKPPDDLVGLVGCAKHPVVLLYGLSPAAFASALLISHGHRERMSAVPLPRDLGVKALAIWGFLTGTATLQMRTNTGQVFYSHTYPGPPPRRECARGTESLSYAFREP